MHNVALIVLYDEQQNVLLQHRTDDAPFFPGYWAFFGGGCEAYETPMETVIRETWEELCYHLISPDFVLEHIFSVAELECRMYLFAERFHGDKNALNLCEGQGLGWFGAGETDLLLMTDHDRKALQTVRVFINGKVESQK
jgi:8-oxo-dGTP diphosphatase